MALTPERKKKYDELEARVGRTPLIEINDRRFNIPRGNRIFAKKEYCSHTGSHYDRYWVKLLRIREEQDRIHPSQTFPLLETTTGNSGAAFAWACRELGYPCEVFIPIDMPRARILQIEYYGAKVSYSPEHEYVRGLIRSFRERLKLKGNEYVITDHATDQEDGVKAIYDLGNEIINDLGNMGVSSIDYFVSALGNGLTTRWIGQAFFDKFKDRTFIIGMEPYESPTVFQTVFPDRFKREYLSSELNKEHELIGTGPGETGFAFPNMRAMTDNNKIKDIYLEKHNEWTFRDNQLSSFIGENVGHTSAACFDVAMKLANNGRVRDKNIVIIFYDAKWKYSERFPQEYRR